MKKLIKILVLLCTLWQFPLSSQTIEEKKLSALAEQKQSGSLENKLNQLNNQIKSLKDKLNAKYKLVNQLHENQADQNQYSALLAEINSLKDTLQKTESIWKETFSSEAKQDEDSFGFWDQEETTLPQVIMEYGAADHLYVIPPEMRGMKLNLHSSLPVPRESWSELLEIMLAQNGIGIKKLNPYARQLYILKQDLIAVSSITNKIEDLKRIPSNTRMIFVFTPRPEQAKSVTYFFERFRDPKKTFIYQVGYKVAIVSMKEEIEKLISLYDAVWEQESEKVTKVFPLKKMTPKDMEKVLKAYFGDLSDRNRLAMPRSSEDLSIMTLSHEASIVLVGQKDMVRKAEEVILETESQITNPCEMTVFWYTCRHSDPVDVANVLERVYLSLIFSGTNQGEKELMDRDFPPLSPELNLEFPQPAYTYGPQAPPLTVNAPVVNAGTVEDQKKKSGNFNFIPYVKTGSIMMVVRRDTLDKIKDLLKKLDVPKKMVHMEVLLFEKVIKNKNNFGLNVLKLGSFASGQRQTGIQYDSQVGSIAKGILQFLITRPKSSSFPAFDIAYNFLMAQEDIRINASPSVTTVNQVPAKVSIVEELSINNGAAPIDMGNGGITFDNSFTRNQYGINIVMTPTVHEPRMDDEDERRFITLETHVNFDTINSDINDRPKVNRRSIENQVRVLDGETIILGGLRKKSGEDITEKIPFLGEIPGIAKLFGTSKLTDEFTEMIIFITPKVLQDSKEELDKFRYEELKKRPGDLPEFLLEVEEAKKNKKKKLFENSFKLLFGNNDSVFKN